MFGSVLYGMESVYCTVLVPLASVHMKDTLAENRTQKDLLWKYYRLLTYSGLNYTDENKFSLYLK